MNGAYMNRSPGGLSQSGLCHEPSIPEGQEFTPPLVRAQSADNTVPSSEEGEHRPLTSSGAHGSVPHSSINIEAQRSAEQQEGLTPPAKEKPVGRSSVNVASIIR